MGTLSKSTYFPAKLSSELLNLVRGKSSLARLSQQKPIEFNGTEIFTFNFDKEADIVAENGAKGVGGGTIAPVTIVPYKIEYGMRVSDEFVYGAEEAKIGYLRAFAEGFAAKAARALDIMAMHGLNPRTGSASLVVGNNHFDYAIPAGNKVTYNSGSPDPNGNVETAIGYVQGAEHEVTGMAMSPAFRTALASQTRTDGTPMFPELAWGSAPDTIKGLAVDTNSTVAFGDSTEDLAIVGNFRDFFRWGVAKDIGIKVIEYGNPDNDADAGDLQGHNQVYLRGEMYIGYGILVPEAFAAIGNFQ
jgi:HK97 family phage major capsid protein